MKQSLSGIVGAPATPFDKNNRVDYETFAKAVNFLIKNGASLMAHPMHANESINLTFEERKELARCFVETVGGRLPTFVHVSFGSTDQSLELASHSIQVGATGIILLAPYYWRSNRAGIIDHFMTVAGNLNGQLIVYNNPSATGVEISPDIFTELLSRLPNFVGLKDASFDMKYFTEICRLNMETGRNIAMFTGLEYLLTSMPVGGRGAFGGCLEIAPRLSIGLYNACAAMDLEKARPLQYKANQLLMALMRYNVTAHKYALELMGRPAGQARKPIQPLTPEAKIHLKETLKSLGILDEEPRGW